MKTDSKGGLRMEDSSWCVRTQLASAFSAIQDGERESDFCSLVRYFSSKVLSYVHRLRLFAFLDMEMRTKACHLLFIFVVLADLVHCQPLRIVTMNIWTGLDYVGKQTIGEYEPQAVRDQRTRILIREFRKLQPDIIALQEVNPVSTLGPAIADAIGYDCIYERANAGLKIGRVGIPTNLNEGLVILAKKSLHINFVDVWDLSGGFGLFGNTASFHWTERRLALVGKIRIGAAEIYIANVHLSSVVPDEPTSRNVARTIAAARTQDDKTAGEIAESFFSEAGNRLRSVEMMLEQLNGPYAEKPLIVLGDFNATAMKPELELLKREANLLEAAEVAGIDSAITWDPERNTNIRYSVSPVDAHRDSLAPYGLLSAWYDGRPRMIDHIYLNKCWKRIDVTEGSIVLDKPEDGLFASDHFGMFAALDGTRVVQGVKMNPDEVPSDVERGLEGFPILSYDTDSGFGYGAKGFFLNYLGGNESLDLTAFNSTKGERWYRVVFSIPDFEIRQGKVYPLSFDLTIDYDKYLKNNFYGIGNHTKESDRETYTKEPLEILGLFSRGLSREIVAQIGLKYRTVQNYGYESFGLFYRSLPVVNAGRSGSLTIYGALRYDSRDSYVNPSRGQVAEVVAESDGSGLLGDYTLTSATFAFQTYHVLFYPKTVFAAKIWGQSVEGSNLPIHVLPSVGGNRTLRGYPQDRFLDNTAIGVNGELRFPLYWRIGGVLGIDAARVCSSFSNVTLADWAYNPVVGLRLYMDTFVVRADVGFGKETTGFYLNFGQLF